MENKTVNCPQCNSANFYSANDELIRCRTCGANIQIRPTENNDRSTDEPAEPIIRIPGETSGRIERQFPVQADMAERFTTYFVDQVVTAMVGIMLVSAGGQNSSSTSLYLILLAAIGYYTLLEGSNGKSIGKLFTRTCVVNEDGSPIGYSTAFYRTLCRMIPFEVFSIFFHNGRCWHDILTRTYVIKDR